MQKILSETKESPAFLLYTFNGKIEKRVPVLYCCFCGKKKDYHVIRSTKIIDRSFIHIDAQAKESHLMCLKCINKHFEIKRMLGINQAGEKVTKYQVNRIVKRNEWSINFCVYCGKDLIGTKEKYHKVCNSCLED